jgi:hypothetical protein
MTCLPLFFLKEVNSTLNLDYYLLTSSGDQVNFCSPTGIYILLGNNWVLVVSRLNNLCFLLTL